MPDTPYIPATITVHLGPPESDAENVTVSFRDYIKNVASSEIYPTWDEAALRANILAQISLPSIKFIWNTTPAGAMISTSPIPRPMTRSTSRAGIFLRTWESWWMSCSGAMSAG